MEPIKKLFQNDFFSKIQKKKDVIDRYEKKLKKIIPAAQQSAFKVINVIDQRVVVEVSSNIMAHQFKLLKPTLTKQSHDDQYPIADLKIKVNPNKNQQLGQPSKKFNLGRPQLKKLKQQLDSSPLKQKLTNILKND